MPMARRQVLKLIERAEAKAKEAADAFASADSAVATYWGESGTSPLWWTSSDARAVAKTLTSLSAHLRMRAQMEVTNANQR